MEFRNLFFLLFAAILFSCTPTKKTANLSSVSQMKFIDSYELPLNLKFQNTTVGGLSGIDYDARQNFYYLICDDRSAINPVRFYTAKIDLNEKGIDSVHLVAVTSILNPEGKPYPPSKQDPLHSADPESIRYNPLTDYLVWSSEGERILRNDSAFLQNPSLYIMDKSGRFKDSFTLPSNLYMQAGLKGPRQNGTLEGLSFKDDYKTLMASMEEPLIEDGARAGLKDSSAWVRIISFNTATRLPTAQYVYQVDPVALAPNPPSGFRINGVSEILAINHHQLLTIERSFSTGKTACTVKIFLVNLDGAKDISKASGKDALALNSLPKKLLFNMDDLGIYIDNVEGLTLGPRLRDGRNTLILVADNNFSKDEISQFFLFTIE